MNGAIHVEVIGAEKLKQAQQALAEIPGGMDKALKSAAVRATSHLRSQSAKEIRKKYDIKTGDIRLNQNITTQYKYRSGVEAIVRFNGKKIPLFRYSKAKPKSPKVSPDKTVMAIVSGTLRPVHPGVAASGHQFRGTGATKFDNAFVARMKSGHTGIFERTGGKTQTGDAEIREVMGSSVPQMLGNEQVADALAKSSMAKMEERLDHEVSRILNGIGV